MRSLMVPGVNRLEQTCQIGVLIGYDGFNPQQSRRNEDNAVAVPSTTPKMISPNKKAESVFQEIFAQDPVAADKQQISEETFLAKFNEEVSFRDKLLANGQEVIKNCNSNADFLEKRKKERVSITIQAYSPSYQHQLF